MFGPLGIWEILLILGIALLIFGPKKLPEVGRTLGRGLGEFRRATTDLKRTIEKEIDLDDRASSKPTPAALPTATGASVLSGSPPGGLASEPASTTSPASGTSAPPAPAPESSGEDPDSGDPDSGKPDSDGSDSGGSSR